MMTNNRHHNENAKRLTIYCSECGKELDEFALSKMVDDYSLLVKNFKDCKKNGKFKGEICSKIFIASNNDDNIYMDSDEFF